MNVLYDIKKDKREFLQYSIITPLGLKNQTFDFMIPVHLNSLILYKDFLETIY